MINETINATIAVAEVAVNTTPVIADPMKAVLYQMLGYMVAMVFSFFLFNYWMRGYFWAYLRVRTSLGKLTLVKFFEPNKVRYKVGKVEESNLLIGTPGKNGQIFTDVQREYMYLEQNVTCLNIDGKTGAFILPEVHYTKVIKPIPEDSNPADYAKAFKADGNEIIVTAVEGFDSGKVDSFVQAAQMRPSQMHKTLTLILMICFVILLISIAGAFGGFMAKDAASKVNNHVGSVEGKIDAILAYVQPVQLNGSIVATSPSGVR